jgi:choline dehydrogenase-like flavoprotein
VYGGYSTHWGGQLLPLAAHDFQPRSHVPDSGWPLDPAELSPYLHRCEELLGANHAPFDASLIDQLPSPTPGNSPVPLQPSAARTCKRATASRSGKPPPPSSTASRGAFNCAWSWLQGMIFLVDRERHGGGSPRNAWFPFEPLAVEALPVAPHIWCGFWAWFLYEPKTTLPPPRGYWCTMTGAARARCG